MTSQIVAKLILGIVFGGLLAVWVSRNYRRPAETKLTLLEKIEGVALVFLLIAGMTTASLDELLRSVSLNDGKVNFQLAKPAARQSSGQEAQSVNTEKTENDSSNKESFFLGGFGPIKGMIGTMKRDYAYIKAHNPELAALLPDAPVLASAAAATVTRAFPAELAVAAPAPPPEAAAPLKLQKIKHHYTVTMGFEASFKTLFDCIAGSLEKTDDRRYLFNRVAPFRPLIGALYLNLIALEDFEGKDLSTEETRQKQQIQARLEEVVSKFNAGDAPSMQPIRAAFTEIKTFGEDYHGVSACADLNINTIQLPDDLKVASVSLRPYLATIYASLLYMDNQKLAAIRTLNADVDKFKTRFKRADVSAPEFWYLQRALFDVIFMVEDFFITETRSPPPDILEMHLNNLKFYAHLIERIDQRIPHTSLFGNHLAGTSGTLVDARFKNDPGFRYECPDKSLASSQDGYDGGTLTLRQAGTFSYLYYSVQSLFVQHALDHPDFNERYEKEAGHLAEVIANIDLHCTIEVLSHPEALVRQQRASFLYIYALYEERMSEAKRNISANHLAWLRDRLDLIDNAATLALQVLARNEATDEDKKDLSALKLESVQAELRYNLINLRNRNQARLARLQ